MKNLRKINLTELSDSEMKETNGGFGLIPLLFMVGFAIAYYEVRIKPQQAAD